MSIQSRGLGMALAGVAGCAAMVMACAPGGKDMEQRQSRDATPVANTPQAGKRPVILFIGTSLTAGYGLRADQAYPAEIERLAESVGMPITAVNAGVSGETSAGALHRIDWVLRTPADVVLIETGANDGLRGLSVSAARSNISAIVEQVRRAKPQVPVLLVQMEAPRNMGAAYVAPFHAMYGVIAKDQGVVLVPFLLDSVAGNPGLNQADGVHPNAAGAQIMARNIWRSVEPVVQALYAARKVIFIPSAG